MSIDENFVAATVRAKELPAQSNETLLQLYALYKQSTHGDVDNERPGGFDFKGQAKFDAWSKLKGTAQDEAKNRYVALVEELAG